MFANFAHEGHDPASEGNFNADIAEQKERRDPRDARGWLFEQSFAEASLFLGLRLLGLSVCGVVDGPGGLPERCRQGDQFDPSDTNLTSQQSLVLQCIYAYHEIVECVPGQAALGDHGRRDERGNNAADAVKGVQEAEQLAGPVEIAQPRVPRSVVDAVAKAREHKGEHEPDKGRVRRNDDVREDVAHAAQDGDAALASLEVQVVVEQRRGDVADKGGEEDERDDGVGQAVVADELRVVSAGGVGDEGRTYRLKKRLHKSVTIFLCILVLVQTYSIGSIIGAHHQEAPKTRRKPVHVFAGVVPSLQSRDGTWRSIVWRSALIHQSLAVASIALRTGHAVVDRACLLRRCRDLQRL